MEEESYNRYDAVRRTKEWFERIEDVCPQPKTQPLHRTYLTPRDEEEARLIYMATVKK
jgi:hypothetical protein